MPAHDPVGHVEVVDVLLDDVVARKPAEVEPVANLPLGVGPVRLPGGIPEPTLVPEDLAAHRGPDLAVVDPLDRGQICRVVPALGAGHQAEPLGLGQRRRGDHRADADRVDRHRLLGEDVLPRGYRGRQVRRPEARRRRQDHQVDVSGQHLLVGVEPGERHVVVHLVHRGELGVLAGPLGQVGAGAGQPVREEVSHRHQLHVVAGAQAVGHGAGAAAAAADDAHPDRVHVGGGCPEVARHRHAGGGHRGGGLDETAAREGGVRHGMPHCAWVTAPAPAGSRRRVHRRATSGSWETAGHVHSSCHPARRARPGPPEQAGRATTRRGSPGGHRR